MQFSSDTLPAPAKADTSATGHEPGGLAEGAGTPPQHQTAAEETLDHMRRRGMKENTLRAMASDLRYLDGWCRAATGAALPLPTPPPLVLRFIAHHLWDPALKAQDPDHGMPDAVARELEASGLRQPPAPGVARRPSAVSTVKRRLASLSSWHRHHPGLRHANPMDSADVQATLRQSARGAARIASEAGAGRRRKSDGAIVADTLRRLVAACEADLGSAGGALRLRALRDRAILLVGWASGGRRRSELSGLRADQLTETEAGYLLALGETKTRDALKASADDRHVPVKGEAAQALAAWLEAARITQGHVFRSIDRHGNLGRSISPDAVNRIVKARAAQAGSPTGARLSAHGLRSGFLTEAARQGVPMIDAMALSDHRSERSVIGYWAARRANENPAGDLYGTAPPTTGPPTTGPPGRTP